MSCGNLGEKIGPRDKTRAHHQNLSLHALSGLPAEKAGKEALFLRCRGRLRLFCLGGGRRGASGRHLGLDGNLRVFLLGLIVDGDFERCFFQGGGIRLDGSMLSFGFGFGLGLGFGFALACGFGSASTVASPSAVGSLSVPSLCSTSSAVTKSSLASSAISAMAEESVGAVAGVPPIAASTNWGDVRPVTRARSAAI